MPPPNTLEMLQASAPAILAEVVRQDQRSPTFDITSWTVGRLSDKGAINPDGIFRFSGHGGDERGSRDWSVVLKLIDEPAQGADITNIWYGKRELYAMRSGLLSRLPADSIIAPRCYGVEERDGCGWIWMEHIVPSIERRWTADEFASAARRIGRFNGDYVIQTPLPDFPWLHKGVMQGWPSTIPPTEAWIWESSAVKQVISDGLRERVLRLWDERQGFFDSADRLPQTFLHMDVNRRNLFLRKLAGGAEEVVAIDWAVCGIGPLGGDLYSLVPGSAILFEIELVELPQIEMAAFDAYLAGLRDVGWNGDADLIRLAYCAWFAMWLGISGPAIIANWTIHLPERIPTLFGRTPEQFAVHLAALCEIAHARADEARMLMTRLL